MSLLPFFGAYSFGDQKRFNQQNQESPGPAQYITNKTKNKPISFTKSEKLLQNNAKVPAVGQYKVQYKQVFKDQNGRSMLKKPKSQILLSNIGPGSYNVQPEKIGQNRYTFGYKFNKDSEENQKDISKNVESKSLHISKNQTFSKQQRNLSVSKLNQIPGPGQYNTDKIQTSCSISFTNGLRPQIYDQNRIKQPGPGYYETPIDVQPQTVPKTLCSFGSRNESVKNITIDYPSPSKYFPQLPQQDIPIRNQREKLLQRKTRFQALRVINLLLMKILKNAQQEIAKGIYIINVINKYQAQVNMKQNQKLLKDINIRFNQEQSNQQSQVPGPGMYNLNTQQLNKNAFIGTSDHLNNKDVLYKSQLGPGQYNHTENQQGPSYSMRQKLPVKVKQLQDPNLENTNLTGFIPNYLMKDKDGSQSRIIQKQK